MKRAVKRLVWFLAAGVLALSLTIAIAAVVFVHELGRKKTGVIQQWIGGQVQSICDAYLKPRLTFSQLRYEYPGTIHLQHLRLTADDPASPGHTIDILQTRQATVQLAEIPRIGRPIQIQRIVLDHPLVRVVALSPGSNRFVGFSDLLKSSTSNASQPPQVKLSDYFQMRQVRLIDGSIIYDTRAPREPPMELGHIQTQLAIVPAGEGWYALQTSLKRPPDVDIAVAGQLNIDTLALRKLDLNLTAQLEPEQLQYLPPQLQQVLQKHRVQGQLDVALSGALPILDYAGGDLAAQVTMRDARLDVGDYNLAVNWMRLKAHLADGKIHVDSMNLSALDGQADLRGMMTLNPSLDSQVKLTVQQMRLDDLYNPPPGRTPPIGGRVDVQLQAAAPLKTVIAWLSAPPSTDAWPPPPQPPSLPTQWGRGFVQLDHGRLMELPILRDLAGKIGHDKAISNNDQGLVQFTLSGNHIKCQQVAVVGSWFAVRGFGVLSLNQTLNFTLNGGPLEKMESLMGQKVGGAIGQVTDALASYHVTGTVDQPQIAMRAGSHALGHTVRDAGDDIQQGVHDIGRTFEGIFGGR